VTTDADAILTRATIERILTRYFIDGDRSPDIVALEKPRCEVDRNAARIILERSELSEEDLSVFGHFIGDSLTILDVGANFGYSATSIWSAGSNASIVSFEPNGDLEPVLSQIYRVVNRKNMRRRGADSRKFEFHMIGISDTVGNLKFVTPVINGIALSALTTANIIPHIHSLASNIFEYTELYMNNQIATSCKLYSFMSPVTTIDKWMSGRFSEVNLRKVVAIKIDTEGFEGNVLVGATNLLKEQHPLIMAECGHINDRARSTVQEHGYVLAAREGSRLTLSNEYLNRVNAFFVHSNHFDYYRRIGLMVDSP
jgi:FkbM family methyltransferase